VPDRVTDPYARIAAFYDLEHDAHEEDIGFYLQYVESAGDPVLEVACGTGRITSAIAEAGFDITGTDVSRAMLDRARQRGGSARYVAADMTEAATIDGGPFGVVIMALGALAHLPSQEEQGAALASAHRALDPRGVLLIDVLHATPANLQALEGIHAEGVWDLPDGTRVERFSSHRLAPASQHIHSRIWYDVTRPDNALERVSTSMTQRYTTPGEISLLLQAAGFQDCMFYGGYELEPLEDASERLVIAAEMTRTA
jgi:SAM-dependent methyltransferase